jgi:hypothetical protein
MVTLVRTTVAQPGKLFDYVAAQKESIAIGEPLTGVKFTMNIGFGGVVGACALIASFNSVADIEAAASKLLADAKWVASNAKAQSLTVPGSTVDNIWRPV